MNQYQYKLKNTETEILHILKNRAFFRSPREEVIYYFKKKVSWSRKISEIRKLLSQAQDFSVANLFDFMDVRKKASISIDDFQKALKQFQLYPEIQYIKLFFDMYAIDSCFNTGTFELLFESQHNVNLSADTRISFETKGLVA